MIIGAVSDPLLWDRWPEAEALLEPARKRGDFANCLEPYETLLVVMDGDELLACATVWHSTEGHFEVRLVGGRDHRRWVKELDDVIGAGAREAGATRLLAIGRAGWVRSLKALGWERSRKVDDHWLFVKEL